MWKRLGVINPSRTVRPLVLAAALTAGLGFAQAADAKTTTISMTGDDATGSLSFHQDLYEIQAGDLMRFVNLSGVATHEPTERHNLWAFSVGTRQYVERTMEAGTHFLYCRLHPQLMKATIRVVPLTSVSRRIVRKRDRRGRLRSRRIIRTAQVRWAAAPPSAGQAFDVDRRRQGHEWERWRSATSTTDGRFTFQPGDGWQIRVRLRGAGAVGDWSPVASVIS